MRTVPASIATMLETRQTTLSRCLKLILRDGFELGFTDHDKDLVVALPEDLYEPTTYYAGHGMIPGDISLAIGLEADNTETSFPYGDLLTRPKLLSRRFAMADAFLFDVDWTQPTPLPLNLMAGYVADVRPEKSLAVFEIRSDADRWNTVIGRIAAPRCTNDFGDFRCQVTPTVYQTTVGQVFSDMRFTVTLPDNLADDFFRFGTAEFMSGALAGTWPYEIVAFDGYLEEVEVLAPMPGFPAPGDEVWLRNGCSKVKKADDPTVPTCLTYANVINFYGLDQLPGTDRYVRFPVPGSHA